MSLVLIEEKSPAVVRGSYSGLELPSWSIGEQR
jgi:hypothetical protein